MDEHKLPTKKSHQDGQSELRDKREDVEGKHKSPAVGGSRSQPRERPQEKRVKKQETSIRVVSANRPLNLRGEVPQRATGLIPREKSGGSRDDDRHNSHVPSHSKRLSPRPARSQQLDAHEHRDEREWHTA